MLERREMLPGHSEDVHTGNNAHSSEKLCGKLWARYWHVISCACTKSTIVKNYCHDLSDTKLMHVSSN